MSTTYHGVPLDTRSELAKSKDFQSIEVASVSPVDWKEKPESEWRKFPIRDQWTSNTCVAQTLAKLLGIDNYIEENNFIVFSARDPYARRANKPAPGMWGTDALGIASTYGITTEERLPSQKMSDAEIEALFIREKEDLEIAEKYKAGGYLQLRGRFIDEIADVIQNKKKGVMLFIWAAWEEWTDVPEIKDKEITLYTAPIRHSVTGVDVTIWKGKKAIVIDDSWGKFYGFKGQRVLTEDFLKERCYFAGYTLDLSNKRNDKVVPPKPKFSFKNTLSYGMMSNQDVARLQKMLKFEELYPQKVETTGNYLQITARAVLAWQIKHGILDFKDEKDYRKVRFGPKSIAVANELYR